MGKGRLEAFSDGVLAIIITIMVLDLKRPQEPSLAALRPLVPVFLGYALSYAYVGIYWNNHHHMLHAARRVTGAIMWANLNLLFWLSLIPFVTAWWGNNVHEAVPTALYGVVLLMAAIAYWVLLQTILADQEPDSPLARSVGSDFKGKASIVIYAVAIGVSFASALAAAALYVLVAVLWLIPDRRMERALADEHAPRS
jgi:uncharacterized membrane protein